MMTTAMAAAAMRHGRDSVSRRIGLPTMKSIEATERRAAEADETTARCMLIAGFGAVGLLTVVMTCWMIVTG